MRFILKLLFIFISFSSFAQTNQALGMSEILAFNARFNPADTRQMDIIKKVEPFFLVQNLKTDDEKTAFWLNVYNSYMLTFLRDTFYEGVYTNFYTVKNVEIGQKLFSLFEIEHEFIRAGKKNKALGFKKSKLKKDTDWTKLKPALPNNKAILCMYRGLYGYPPFQVVENGNVEAAWLNSLEDFQTLKHQEQTNSSYFFDWIKPYKIFTVNNVKPSLNIVWIPTPLAVYILHFYPKYEGTKFKEEDNNPWLK